MKNIMKKYFVAVLIIVELLSTQQIYACYDWSDSDDWDINDWCMYIWSGNAEDDGIDNAFIYETVYELFQDHTESELEDLLNVDITVEGTLSTVEIQYTTGETQTEYVLTEGSITYVARDTDGDGIQDVYETPISSEALDLDKDGIADDMEVDSNNNGIDDSLEDGDGDGIIDKEDENPETAWWDIYLNNDIISSGTTDQEIADEQAAYDDIQNALEANTPLDPIDSHIYTPAEKQQILNLLLQELTIQLTARDGVNFVPFAPTSNNQDKVGRPWAIYEKGNIYVSNKFFNTSKQHQKSILVHENKHYQNELNGLYPLVYDINGDIVQGEVEYTYQTAKLPDNIIERQRVLIKKEYDNLVITGIIFNQTFDSYWNTYKKSFLDQRVNTTMLYKPSNLYKDEIDSYTEQIKGHQDGLYTLTEEELLPLEIQILQFENKLIYVERYERENNIKPSGEGFVKP